MFLTFLFPSAPEEDCISNRNIGQKKKKILKKHISVIRAFVVYFYQVRHLRRYDQSALSILYLK